MDVGHRTSEDGRHTLNLSYFMNLFMKLNSLGCVMFALGCELRQQSLSQHQRTQIVFMYGDILQIPQEILSATDLT